MGNCNGREPLISADGINWFRLGVPAIPSSDESNFSYDRHTKTFIATVKTQRPGSGVRYFFPQVRTLKNGLNRELIFHADERDQELGRENIKRRFADPSLHHPPWNHPEVYKRRCITTWGFSGYEGLYVGMPAMYHAAGSVPNYPNTVGFQLIQLACSRDLKSWKRLGDRKAFIGPSTLASGAYDPYAASPAIISGNP